MRQLTARLFTWDERAVVTAVAVRQLAVLFVARMQVLLVELLVVIIVVATLDRPASQLGGLECAELQFVVEVKRRRTALVVGLVGAAEIELFTAGRIGVQAVWLGTFEYVIVVALDLLIRVTWFVWSGAVRLAGAARRTGASSERVASGIARTRTLLTARPCLTARKVF